jgi:hypothetical protein
MGTLNNNKLINKYGVIRTNTNSDVVDIYGNIRTSSQFKNCKVVDIYGNVGCMTLTPIGFYNGQANTNTPHILTYTYDYQTFGGNYTPPNIVEFGALAGYHIVFTGVISGLQVMRIAGSDDSLGEFNGGGTVIFTGNNSYSNITYIQGPDAHLVLGTIDGTSGSIFASEAWVETGATLDVLGAYTSFTSVIKSLTSIAGSTTNYKGPGVCGQGMFNLNQSGSGVMNGTLNIENAIVLQKTNCSSGPNGLFNILDGGTLEYNNFTNNLRINLYGCGWCDAAGVEQGALSLKFTQTIDSIINVADSACIKTATGITSTFAKPLTGSAPLELSNIDGTSSLSTKMFFTDVTGGTTYNGVITVKNLVVRAESTTLAAADFLLTNNGFLQTSRVTAGYTVDDITISTPESGISVFPTSITLNNVCGKIFASSFSAPNGFTVNAYSNLKVAGTYDILVVSGAHTTTLPTVGENTTGKAISFAWVGGTLKMTLA